MAGRSIECRRGRSLVRRVRAAVLTVVLGSVLAIGGLTALSACRARQGAPQGELAAAPEVRDDSKGLMFTWIDERGEFHVELEASRVPPSSRERVRVLDPEHPPADATTVFLVDLTKRLPDGRYVVTLGKRADFEETARQRRVAAGALPEPSRPAPSEPGAAAGAPVDPSAAVGGPVIIYGASWCGACRQAEAYLRSKRVPFEHKDIEEDRGAALEMRGKLAKANLRGGSIPVLDVRGKVIVGFSPAEVDAALAATSVRTL